MWKILIAVGVILLFIIVKPLWRALLWLLKALWKLICWIFSPIIKGFKEIRAAKSGNNKPRE